MNTIIDHFSRIIIIQVGCGGTGSWLVPLVSKLANNIKLRLPLSKLIEYIIIDNDIVEDRNILRQNFSNWDIGKIKSQALVNKACYEFEEIVASSKRIQKTSDIINIIKTNLDNCLIIMLGCVDNNISRHNMLKISKKLSKQYKNSKLSIVYIDSGNLLHNGQIITQAFNCPDWISQKPSKKKLNFKHMFPINEEDNTPEQSCAFFGDQSQAINSLAATLMFINLQKILVTSELPPELITFNSSGYSTFEI